MPAVPSWPEDIQPAVSRLEQLRVQSRTGEYKRETRRKILAGAAALKHAEADPDARSLLWRLLDDMLDENRDRELFDLEPLEVKRTRRRRQPELPWDGEIPSGDSVAAQGSGPP